MSILGTYTKQPAEVLDYDIDFTDWIGADTLATASAVATPSGITIDSTSIISPANLVAKVMLSGGTAGVKYKIEVTVTTTPGALTKQEEFYIRVRNF